MDSTIRLRQLNQAELSGFVSGVFSLFPKTNISGNLISSGSGIADIGSSSYPYAKIFANQFNLPNGSGMNFGNTSFRAYTSGGFAYVNVGGITISSSGDSTYIQGVSGTSGLVGQTGARGLSGIGVTGVSYDTNSHILTFSYSNGNSTGFNFQGLSGDTGISVTGFFRSGNLIYPQYDHFRGTGKPIELVAGPAGPPGGINLFFEKSGLDVQPEGTNFPQEVVINPYYDSSTAPKISLMRGMAYNMDASGLATYTLTTGDIAAITYVFSGVPPPYTAGEKVNYFYSGENTGYWRFAFFPKDTPTGFYDSIYSPSIFSEASNFEVYGQAGISNLYRTKFSFSAGFRASDEYKYGFMVYTMLGGETSYDYILTNTGYAYVLGDVVFSSGVGPPGSTGPSGERGGPGIQGPPGPSGLQGDLGTSVVGYNQQQLDVNSYQIQFIYSDGATGPWVNLPSGGPSGVAGPSGARGSLTNVFRGEYSDLTTYSQDDTVTNSGSSYVYINGTPDFGHNPSNGAYWQLIAQKGDIGPSGATGYADRYSSRLNVVSGFPTGVGSYANSITGITVNGTGFSGTMAKFATGQVVSFRNSGTIGYSYTPYQSIMLASNTYTGTYCYGSVRSYNQLDGTLSFLVVSGGTGIPNVTISGGTGFLWYNYGDATINLGANIVSGASGQQGPPGIQGPPGAGSALRCQKYTCAMGDSVTLNPAGINITGGLGIELFSLIITGDGQLYGNDAALIDFDWTGFQTGQSVVLRIRNSGIPNGNGEPPLFYFTGSSVNTNAGLVKWPNSLYSRPNDAESYIYTFVRFPDDEPGKLLCYGTYSNPYN